MHGECHQPALNVEFVKQNPWECPDCKGCNICDLNNEEDKIIICDMCDKARHIHCLSPPLPVIPSQSWFCDECIKCSSCNKTLPNIKLRSQGYWHGPNKRLCKPCLLLIKDGNYCHLCCKAFTEESNEENYIQCDFCQKWVHAKCDGID